MKATESVDISHDAIVGVLLTKRNIRYLKKGLANKRILLLHQANKKAKTTMYFFSIDNIRLRHLTIEGFYYDDESKRWLSKSFPFPTVLYKRGGVFKSEKKNIVALSKS
ncbi:hypothetical protein [Heliorestis convoluta]|uniref:YheC/YheD family protein n=1 Tax=Heliorestis convoluta TaxID=356322 RepID=A0A5Q2N0P8_9FIRM|nr:hypothetical protein [Heliorestis convoluta]QGG48578.1 YheC/YheD family protein [Heliorestis convoluta]